jgi:hypothetical protein
MRFAKWLFAALLIAAAPHPAASQQQDTDISSLAALRALPSPQSPAELPVRIRRYGGASAYGGGIFAWYSHDERPDDDGMVIKPANQHGPGSWVRVPEEPGVISPLYYGALCDGRTDDTAAINRAIAFVRAQGAHGDMARQTGILRFPAAACLIKGSINATGLTSTGVMLEGTGGTIICEAAGKPCLDAMNSGRLGMRDITIYGEPTAMPRTGLQVGRPFPRGSAAGMYLDHVTISGFFSFAAFFNLSAETQLAEKLNASNQADGGYGAVYDGLNHWRVGSEFTEISFPYEQSQSFNDNSCINCRITVTGRNAVPLWAAGTAELTFQNSYISNFGTGPGAVLYAWNTNLNFDVHFEAAGLTNVFVLTGKRHYRLYGLIYREHDFFGTQSLFGLGDDVESASLEDIDVNIGRIHSHGTWFDDPAKYTVSGRVAGVYADGWATPGGGFSGTACFGTKCFTQ